MVNAILVCLILTDSTIRFLEVKADIHFVKTKQYAKAKDILQDKNILILTGNPGEGKTAMAAHLALEDNTRKENCIKLESVRDWEDVDWSLRCFTTVIIDDIFGGIALDYERLREWKTVLSDIEQRAKDSELKVIITSRHYIKEEARCELDKITMFSDSAGYTVYLDSKDLSSEEMKQMLKVILDRNGIRGRVDLDICVKKARGVFNFKSEVREECVFGFPECAMLFAAETLFHHGTDFFQKPELHFKTYIKQLYKPEETEQYYKFIALVAVWAEKSYTISESDIRNPKNVSSHIRRIANCFGIEINHEFLEIVRVSLHAYTNFLFLHRNDSGEYTFTHNVIGEMVGIVLGEYKPLECITLCQRDFIMQRVTLFKTTESDLKVSLPDRLHKDLCEKFIRLISRQDCSDKPLTGSAVNSCVRIPLKTVSSSSRGQSKLFSKPQKCIDVDINILNHEAFQRKSFVELFTNHIVDTHLSFKLFNYPIQNHMLDDGHQMYMLDCILEYGHTVLAEQIISKIELFLKPHTTINSKSVSVVIHLLPLFLSKVIESSGVRLNDRCTYKPFGMAYTYPLIVATTLNQEEAVKCLIKNGACVNVADSNRKTSLHYAASGGHNDVVTKLLDSKADVDAKDINGQTALIVAAKEGHNNVVKACLQYGADVNQNDIFNRTALCYAVFFGHKDVVAELVGKQADINVINPSGQTHLMLATIDGNLNVVKTCLHYGADVNQKDGLNKTALHYAALSGHSNIARELLDNQADVKGIEHSGKTPLIEAAMEGHLTAVKTCLQYGADVRHNDIFNRTAVYYAAYYGHSDVVTELLDNQSDLNVVDIDGLTPLIVAAMNGHLTAVKTCLQYGADVNHKDIYNRTAVYYAASYGHTVVMTELLENQADLNGIYVNAYKLLRVAAINGQLTAVNTCLQNGADVNQKDKFNRTALHYAAAFGYNDVVTELLNNQSDLNVVDIDGRTPLIVAAMNGHCTAVKTCLQYGADVNHKDKFNRTAVYYAASYEHNDVMTELLDSNAGANAINID